MQYRGKTLQIKIDSVLQWNGGSRERVGHHPGGDWFTHLTGLES